VRATVVASVLCLAPAVLAAVVLMGCASPLVCSWLPPAVALLVLTAGVLASYLVHELAHLLVLVRAPGASSVRLTLAFHRVSVEAAAGIRPRWRILASVCGPLAGALVAGAVGVVLGQPLLLAVAALHVAMLLPLFGDGRALIGAVRSLRSTMPTSFREG
jgi:hypothetical protein